MTLPSRELMETLLGESAQRHQHLCPRQVLGVRLGLIGLRTLGALPDPPRRFQNEGKWLLCIVETDGCGADGISIATDCSVGKRTLRVLDYGKVAATLVDSRNAQAIRVAPAPNLRALAREYAPKAESRWHSYLYGYQRIPDEVLATFWNVRLLQSPAEILSRPNARACCTLCGEEIINEREVWLGNQVLCRHCAGSRYYEVL